VQMPLLDKLIEELNKAHRIFTRAIAHEVEGNNPKQQGAIDALSAVMNFLRASGVDRRLYAPIAELQAGLFDASEGRSSGILQRHHKQGASTKPVMRTRNMAAASAAVTILKDDGVPLDLALQQVAREIGVGKDQLGEFRKNIGKGRATTEAIEDYEWFLNTARSYRVFSAKQQAHFALLVARDWKG
jgi:hypothetical protein